jgi:hypothetical protein
MNQVHNPLTLTYYVSTSGNDANTGLSQAQAWQTLAYAESHATTPGCIIALKKGDTFTVSYHSIIHGGSTGIYITWDGSLWGSGANAIIQITADHAGIPIVNITGCKYVNFQNITVEGNSHNCYDGIIIGGLDEVTPVGTQNDEQYIYVYNCAVQNIRSGTWSSGIHIQTDHNNISKIYVIGNRVTNISNHGIAWYNGKISDGADGNFAVIDSYCAYNTIDLCGRLENEVSSCIMITQDVQGMVCEHNNLTGGGDGDAPGIAVGGGSQGVWPTDLTIRYNYINCQSGEHAINFNQGGDITCDVYYNILFSANISTIEIFASTSPNYTNASMRFYNNTIITSTAYGAFKNGCSIVGSATFKNNLCYSTVAGQYGGYVITCNTANNTIHSNNLMYRTEATNCYHVLNGSNYTRTTVPTFEPTVVVTNPVFVTNFTNLHLQAGSPAINAGVNIPIIPQFDYDGVAVANPPEIGAYEKN